MKTIILASLLLCAAVQSSTQQQQQQADQTYNFKYSTGNDGPAQIWREERREADGTIVGKYGYIDPNGEERVVEYRADPENFSATGAIGPDNAALRFSQQQQSSASRDAARAMNDWNRAAGQSAAIQSQPRQSARQQQQAQQRQVAAQNWAAPQPIARQQQQIQRQPQVQSAAPVVASAAIPANWPPAIPTWENLPRQQQPLVQAQPQPSWASPANTQQWNSAWQNFNWNENNARVMADWSAPVQAAPAPVAPAPQPIAPAAPVQPAPIQRGWNNIPQSVQPQAAPIAPSQAGAITTGPNGAWNMFTEIDHADGGLRRPQLSPVAAIRNQQIASQPTGQAVQPAWPQWAQGAPQGFARRTGPAKQARQQVRAQPAPTVVSQDPFSFSFGVDHQN